MSIIPTILTDSIDIAQQQLNTVHSNGKLSRVQIDIIDPDFADEITIFPVDVPNLNLHNLNIDIHLMTNEPIDYVEEASQIPGINMIIGQIERMHSIPAFIDTVHELGMKAGLSLDLHTPIEEIETVCMNLDALQIMSVPLGKQGQQFIGELALSKIKEVAELVRTGKTKLGMEILVDGGITPAIAPLCLSAGATDLVVGSDLWKSSSFEAALEALLHPTLH